MSERLEKERKTEVSAVMSFILVLAIIGITIAGIILLVINKRVAKEEENQRIVPAVEVVEVEKSDHRVVIETQGVVESVRETDLAAEVGGRVMEISSNLRRGGRVREGERLVRIDPADYRAAQAAAEMSLAETEVVLEQERAKVEQAKIDWERLGRGKRANALVLREPYLAAAEAREGSARENALKARRDVERTEILAPFDAAVRSVGVEVGAVVAPGTRLARIYSADDLEVRLPLGLEDFGFLDRDQDGTGKGEVVLSGRIGTETYEWRGEMVRIDPEIDRASLSASTVVRVIPGEDSGFPLPPVGLFVNARVEGKTLDDVAEIPRKGLLEGNRIIVVGKDGRIEMRDVEVVRLTEDTAVVRSGLAGGDKLVMTRMSAPVNGMEVMIEPGDPETE